MDSGVSRRSGDASRWIRPTILIVGTIVILFMTFFSGMRSAGRRIKAIDQERKVAEQQYREAQRDLQFRLVLAQQLEARRRLDLALQELDRRNFGVAQEQVKAAGELLIAAQKAGTTAPDFTAIAATLEATNIVGAADVAAGREPLLKAISEMDAALSDFLPAILREKAEFDAAHPIVPPTLNDVPLPPGNEVMRRK